VIRLNCADVFFAPVFAAMNMMVAHRLELETELCGPRTGRTA
jgi:hypothetical protein